MASPQESGPCDPLLMEEEEAMEDRPCYMDDVEWGESPESQDRRALNGISHTRSTITVAILSFINLIIFINRSSVGGVLPFLQRAFKTSDGLSGLLNTAFIGSYVLASPICGYLGDHWNRKYIICVGVTIWSSVTLALSFIPNEYFLTLLLTSGLVGAGEAIFITIAPTIIADLFVGDKRTRMLTLFNVFIPVGVGLGYIIGSKVTMAARGDWHWAFRVTPGLGLIALFLVIVVIKEPTSEAKNGKEKTESLKNWLSDVRSLFKNPSFIFTSLGSTAVAFIVGAIGIWGPSFLMRARTVLQDQASYNVKACDNHDSLIFGVITVGSGIIGIVGGSEISKRFRKVNPRADPLVCGFSMLSSSLFLYLCLVLGGISIEETYAIMSIGEMLLAMNFAIVADIILYVVTPSRRSTAHAMQITIYHVLGDAGSPYIIGLISDLYSQRYGTSPLQTYRSLEYALMTCAFIGVIGGAFFMATALYIEKDRREAEMESEDHCSTSCLSEK